MTDLAIMVDAALAVRAPHLPSPERAELVWSITERLHADPEYQEALQRARREGWGLPQMVAVVDRRVMERLSRERPG